MVTVNEYIRECEEWLKRGGQRGTNQRLGQWLMNRLLPGQAMPYVWYESDPKRAAALFRQEFVR